MNENGTPDAVTRTAKPAPYWNPYVAGLLLGAALLASFLILGAGLGASAAPARVGAYLEHAVEPERTAESQYFGKWFGEDGTANPLLYYLVFMFAGVFLGGLFSAAASGRIKPSVERGQKASAVLRLILALAGGVIVGYASRLAAGCTSGQALTGGALLMNGSIVFLLCVFAGGYAAALLVRRQWRD
jgi:uncharacterized membrane protein YedE/YeeE